MTTSSNANERKQLFNNNFSPKKEMIDNSTNSNQSNVSNVSTNSTPLNGLPPPTSSNNGPNSSSSTSSSPHPLNSNGTNGSNSDLGGLVPPGSTFPGLSPASAAEMMSRVAAASAGWPYNPTAVPPPGWPYNPGTMAKSPFLLPPFLSLPPDQLAAMGQPLPGSTGPDGPPGTLPALPTGPMDMKDLEAAWSGLPYPPSAYYPYDGSLPGYFPNGCVSMYVSIHFFLPSHSISLILALSNERFIKNY